MYVHSVGNIHISFVQLEGINFDLNSSVFYLKRDTVIFRIKSAYLKTNNIFLRYALYDVKFETICYRSVPFDEITSLYQ